MLSILLLIKREPKLLLLYKEGVIPYDLRVDGNGAVKWFEIKGILLNVYSVPEYNEYKREIVINFRLIVL